MGYNGFSYEIPYIDGYESGLFEFDPRVLNIFTCSSENSQMILLINIECLRSD